MPIITYEKDGAVGVVTMAKPPHNLIDETFLDELLAAYRSAVASDGCRGHPAAQRHAPLLRGCRVNAFTGGGRRRVQKDSEQLHRLR